MESHGYIRIVFYEMYFVGRGICSTQLL